MPARLTLEEFISKCREKHGETEYNYDLVNYVNNTTKVTIQHNVCGNVFKQAPAQHLIGQGCPKCGGTGRVDLEEFIKRCKENYGEEYDYSQVKLKNLSCKITITHNVCGETFEQIARNHMNGSGHYECYGNPNKTLEEFIAEAKQTHPNDEYSYENTVYINARTKVEILHKICGRIFNQSPLSHLAGTGCPRCGGTGRISLEEFINESKKKHEENEYNYSQVILKNIACKVIITHNICGKTFEQKAQDHMQGHGCFLCYGFHNKTLEEFIADAKIVHPNNEYNYKNVVYINTHTKVEILHNVCGKTFIQSPESHLMGSRCTHCYPKKIAHTTEQFIQKCIAKHGNEYNYDLVNYVRIDVPVDISHPKCGRTFKQTPHSHLAGAGCPFCCYRISKPEIEWLDSLGILEENRQKRIKIDNKVFKADGFDPFTNTIYEFYGDFWHGNPNIFISDDINPYLKKTYGELYQKTLEKEKILKNAGYEIVHIWESDFNKQKKVTK